MDIRAWRLSQSLTLQELAVKLAIGGANAARTAQRYESGESPCPADVVERARVISGGVVTPNDFHDVRLAFLRSREASAANVNDGCAA
jgi:hypothetical protein